MCLTELILYSRFRARQNFPLDAGPALVAILGPICDLDEFPDRSGYQSENLHHFTTLPV